MTNAVRNPVGGRRAVPLPGDRHLCTDSGLPSYDEPAATLVTERVPAFLDRVGRPGGGAHR